MLEKSNFGMVNYDTQTVTEQFMEMEDERHNWEPKEPKHYVLLLFCGWAFLGTITFSMEQW